MNSLNNCVDEVVECPLCMEPLEVDDLNFYPCTCGYQICRFCWHRIRTDENELCPACRKEYPENPADFKPLTQEEMIAFKSQKRQRDQQRKQKITENRKHLVNVRVVQKNLVFVVGLPPRLADADILKKHEYFGKYGKIHKVVINPSTAYAGVQGPSASAYVTYVHNTDALRAIQSVNNIMIDGRLIKTSLGTTKYCSHFMKNQQCPKGDCMYLHELGDPEASFTKEEMHQGKHQEYERRLHDVLNSASTGCGVFTGSTGTLSGSSKCSESSIINNISTSDSSATSPSTASTVLTNNISTVVGSVPQKEAWPSLSISPVNPKDYSSNNGNKNKKDRTKQDKNKTEKNSKVKSNKNNTATILNSLPKVVDLPSITENPSSNNLLSEQAHKSKLDKFKERSQNSLVNRLNPKKGFVSSHIGETDMKGFSIHSEAATPTSLSLGNNNGGYLSNKMETDNNTSKIDRQRPVSSSSNSSSSCNLNTSENNSLINDGLSGKSSPNSFNENSTEGYEHAISLINYIHPSTLTLQLEGKTESNNDENKVSENCSKPYGYIDNLFRNNEASGRKKPNGNKNISMERNIYLKESTENINDNEFLLNDDGEDSLTDTITKLRLCEENSFFSSTTGALQSMPLHLKQKDEFVSSQSCIGTTPNLPDLINGIDGYPNNANEFQSDTTSYIAVPDLRRQTNYLQYHQLSNESSNDNIAHNSLFGTNMSKFFDFHKHQQQKLQHCLQVSGHCNINSAVNENFHMPPMEHNRLNSQLIDQSCINTSLKQQQHHQKQKLFIKTDQMVTMLGQQKIQQVPNHQITSLKPQQHQYGQSSACDDDLGFDPFVETQKALAKLIENEDEQNVGTASKSGNNKPLSNMNQPYQQHIFEHMHRTRMPPPGFNHVNNFSEYDVVPRVQNSKIISFMNSSNNYAVPHGQHIQHQQQLQVPRNVWDTHLGNFQQPFNDQQIRQVNSNPMPIGGSQKGYTGNDWTAMDPAILSFRQFSFPYQQQGTTPMQPQQQEIYLQQLAQQPGFTSQSQHSAGGNIGMPNNFINSQQGSQAHVNANVQGMLEYLKTRQFV